MYVLYKGKKLPVDDSNLTDDEKDWLDTRHAVVVDEGMKLIPTYLVTFQKRHSGLKTIDGTQFEFVAEKIFLEKPNEDLLMQEALVAGLSWHDIILIEQVYQLLNEEE